MHAARILLVVLACAGIARLRAADDPLPKMDFEEREQLVERMNGVFDFSKSPRPYVVLLILDQEGNRFPSYWAGRNHAGETTIRTTVDELENRIVLTQEGAFSVRITNWARKIGMQDRLPSGALTEDLGEREFLVTFTKLKEARITGIREGRLYVDCDVGGVGGKESRLITVTAECTGRVSYGERSGGFSGPVELTFMDSVTLFAIKAEFDFPGEALGVGEGIRATLWTGSAENVRKPDPVEDAGINIDFDD